MEGDEGMRPIHEICENIVCDQFEAGEIVECTSPFKGWLEVGEKYEVVSLNKTWYGSFLMVRPYGFVNAMFGAWGVGFVGRRFKKVEK